MKLSLSPNFTPSPRGFMRYLAAVALLQPPGLKVALGMVEASKKKVSAEKAEEMENAFVEVLQEVKDLTGAEFFKNEFSQVLPDKYKHLLERIDMDADDFDEDDDNEEDVDG